MNDLRWWVDEIVADVRRAIAEQCGWPEAAYRLQFNRERMTFNDAAALVPYLHELGISHVYASPCMKAAAGSPHGYDVVDYGRLNAELGGAEGYSALAAVLHQHGMGLIQDIVPNHMGIVAAENAWWSNVLENGPGSPYAHYFDIDWHPVKTELKNKVLLPLLGDQYGEVLESGQLRLEYHDGAFFLRYFQQRLPLDPRTYPIILTHRLDELKDALGAESDELRELESILTALEYLPPATETETLRATERQREKEVIKGRLRRLAGDCQPIAEFIERNLRELNGTPDDPRSFDRLDSVLNAQVYRLAHWKSASDEVNYRRFFDINELAAVCTEDPQVFDPIHQLIFDMLVRGEVDGLRIDHIDGLFDPLEYLWRLQWGYVQALARAAHRRLIEQRTSSSDGPVSETLRWEAVEPRVLGELWRGLGGHPPPDLLLEGAPATEGDSPIFAADTGIGNATSAGPRKLGQSPVNAPPAAGGDHPTYRLPLYVLVEKILSPEEPLPETWPVAGTTGYDFLNMVNRVSVDRNGLHEMLKIYKRFTGQGTDFREVTYQAKLLILRVAMSSDLHLLANRLNRISERHRRTRDYTLNSLRLALREILTCFPEYRTYIRRRRVSERDRSVIHRAVAQAKRRNPARDSALFDFIRDVLLLEQPPGLNEAGRDERDLLVGRFQQVTSPLVAKGIEDTAFYQYLPLASLNEVGGDPVGGGGSVADFHAENRGRLEQRPGSLITTTTHDTKRSEDIRARINVLSEIPQQWRPAVNRWSRLNRRRRREVDGLAAPSRNDEYLLYQTLLGVWPLDPPDAQSWPRFVERIQGYMEKATREAKRRTSWINPNEEYDAAVRDFVAAVLDDNPKNRFLAELRAFEERVVDFGLYSALSQVLLKLTSPGVPDVYQGQELWEFWLVDPDNRRPVDFDRRKWLLAEIQAAGASCAKERLALARHLAENPRDSRLKLLVTWQALQFRRRRADLFRRGRYEPLAVEGFAAEHVCAFAWRRTPSAGEPEEAAIVVVPRLLARLASHSQEESETPWRPLGETVWRDTRLLIPALPPDRPLTNLFTGQTCPFDEGGMSLASVFSDFPVALLSNLD
ncbi:MAG: malto-oligosyltrehalose synthase [Planctomycetes bacterium]|nr:malto-oligosyltrehalose synthase [Planctomycetota bacterium]MBU4399575.1 malto-oligosyltrehalose synthase [Planctomycetota bacterium]MCG2684732.1 malto-oligosyltrehalose synthase [Planctomycetales bacterium]